MNLYLLALQFGGAPGWLSFAPLLFIFAIFYFILIMPQQRKQKKWQEMLGQLKTGDRVTTNGGIRGTVLTVKDDLVVLQHLLDGCEPGHKNGLIRQLGGFVPQEVGRQIGAILFE